MKRILLFTFVVFSVTAVASAQKGVDSQTRTIKDGANRETARTSDASRSFNWGKDKTHVRPPLANPYKFSGRRDALVETVVDVLREMKLQVDEASSRFADGIVVTQPFIFAKGPVVAQSELRRLGEVRPGEEMWSRGRVTYIIEVQPIDGTHHNVSVNAKIEGLMGVGLGSEWAIVPSSGVAEDQFLSKLVEALTGTSPDAPQTVN